MCQTPFKHYYNTYKSICLFNSHREILNGMDATVIPSVRRENGGTLNEIRFLKAREEAESRFRLMLRRPHSNRMLLL